MPIELGRTGRTKSTELVGRHCLGAPAGESAAHGGLAHFDRNLQNSLARAALVGGLFNLW